MRIHLRPSGSDVRPLGSGFILKNLDQSINMCVQEGGGGGGGGVGSGVAMRSVHVLHCALFASRESAVLIESDVVQMRRCGSCGTLCATKSGA